MNSEIIAIEPTLDINTEKKTINIRKDILAPMFGGPIVFAEGIIIGGICIVCGTVVAGCYVAVAGIYTPYFIYRGGKKVYKYLKK